MALQIQQAAYPAGDFGYSVGESSHPEEESCYPVGDLDAVDDALPHGSGGHGHAVGEPLQRVSQIIARIDVGGVAGE